MTNGIFPLLNIKSENIFLIDEDKNVILTYSKAASIVDQLAGKLKAPGKKLVFLFCENNYQSILNYLAVLKSGHAVLLLDNKLNETIKSEFISIYSPEIIISPDTVPSDNYIKEGDTGLSHFIRKTKTDYPPIHPQLAVLLSTSGTTGSPKLVRLSYGNIESNAASIVQYLNINSSERGVTSLPMSYSYGLSVINSHLAGGGSLLLTRHSYILQDFWQQFKKYECTSFAGVPYSYEILKRINFEKTNLPSLRTLTQAGGRLRNELIKYFHSTADQKGIKFYVMYGQTEATARISYLPPDLLPEKSGSIGIPIPGGKLDIMCDDKVVTEPDTTGEIVYTGQNVMLGYAQCREDLSKSDELKGVLYTGDLGYKTAEGLFYITGRLKRFIKLFGLRLNLDDVEKMLETNMGLKNACSGNDEKLFILIADGQPVKESEVQRHVSMFYNIIPSAISVKKSGAIPVTSSGKTDYNAVSILF